MNVMIPQVYGPYGPMHTPMHSYVQRPPIPSAPIPRFLPHQVARPIASGSPPFSATSVTEPKESVEKTIADLIAHYISKNEHVSIEKVINTLFKVYKVGSWSDLNINDVKNPYEDLKPLSHLVKRHNGLDLFIEVYKQKRVLLTLYELEQEILDNFQKTSFNELKLGPLQEHPAVRKLFSLSDKSPRTTESTEIIGLFYDYTRNLKYNEQVDFDDFKEYAAEKFNEDQWTDLGVVFTSFPYLLQEICRQYEIDGKSDFTVLGHGDFIKFLYDHQKVIDNNLEFYLFNADSCGGIKRAELFTFVHHLLNNGVHDKKIIEKTVKYHFNLQILKQVGFHDIDQLCERAQQQKYEEVLLGDEYLNKLGTTIHRPFIRDDDHLCEYLTSCPMVVDIASWSHWNCLYMREKGYIKEFLQRNKTKLPNILWLEVSSRHTQFIRLSSISNMEKFEKDLMNMHLKEAVAHLLSLAIKERGCTRLPIVRLRTIMTISFTKLKQSNSSHDAIGQIVNFLSLITFPFSSALVQTLILDPAEVLFPNCEVTIWQYAKHNLLLKLHLEELGLMLGIHEWTQDLNNEVTYLSNYPTYGVLNEAMTTVNNYVEQKTTETVEKTPKQVKTVAPARPVVDANVDNSNNNIEPFEHIQQIRKTLGNNSDSSDKNYDVIDNLQDLLGECLKKLADDLYSEQVHFILELIQNADDNDYSDLNENFVPKLKFIINQRQITIYNNENDFQKKHIKAICAVSDRSEIHSNNYHICFDATDGDRVGYVCQIWLNEYEPIIQNDDYEQWNTCIRLNLKADEHIQEQIKEKFDNIDPKLLLFLHRLKSLEISYENHYTKTFTRNDHPNNIIELSEFNGENEQKNYWPVIKKILSVSETLQ
ncbi:unnamed protein product, partial [Rotaria sp. Silwood2]